jgi:hypothetical protein
VTAGVKTAVNDQGEAFGLSGFEETLCDGLGAAPGHVLSEFATELTDFVEGGACPEDLTVILLQRS